MTLTKILSVAGMTVLLGAGVVTGGVVVSNAQQGQPQAASAANGSSGVVTLDLTINWASANCNVAVYFYDNNNKNTNNGWSKEYVSVSAGHEEARVTYEFNWTPTHMVAVRYNSAWTEDNWKSNRWGDNTGWTDGPKWNQTQDLTLGEHIRITDWGWGETNDYATIQCGNQDGTGWSQLATLNSIKNNGDNHCEYYASTTLTAGKAFKAVFGGVWYGNYSIGEGVNASDFSSGNDGNININKTGNYILYFDAHSKNIHIANPTYAEADEWAQSFLNTVGCDPQGVNLPSGWNSLATSYAALSSGAKDDIYGATANENGNYIEEAVARYDYAVSHHPSLTRFITNGAETATRSAPLLAKTSNINNSSTLIITLVSVLSVAAAGTYFFLRKKRVNN